MLESLQTRCPQSWVSKDRCAVGEQFPNPPPPRPPQFCVSFLSPRPHSCDSQPPVALAHAALGSRCGSQANLEEQVEVIRTELPACDWVSGSADLGAQQ